MLACLGEKQKGVALKLMIHTYINRIDWLCLAYHLADSMFGSIVMKYRSKKDGWTEGQTDVIFEIAI